jgi:hypothetical protein
MAESNLKPCVFDSKRGANVKSNKFWKKSSNLKKISMEQCKNVAGFGKIS